MSRKARKRMAVVLALCAGLFLGICVVSYGLSFTQRPPQFVSATADVGKISDINFFAQPADGLLIPTGKSGEWDEHIREIGNIVYHPGLERYFFFYSGYAGDYGRHSKEVYVGVASSPDGQRWEKHGKALDVPSEDPYVVVKDGTFYLFYEDKHPDRHTFISVATSTDGIEWKVARKGAVRPTGTNWQEVIVASPIVTLGPAGWIMLYEGCSSTLFTVNGGTIGYAVSEDLLDWEQIPEPVFEGSGYLRYDWLIDYHWAHHIVPDDIIKDGEEYVMTYHGWSKWWGWQSGFATSSDLLSWHIPYDYPMSPLSTIMMARMEGEVRFYATTEKGVEFLRPFRGLTPEEARAAGLE